MDICYFWNSYIKNGFAAPYWMEQPLPPKHTHLCGLSEVGFLPRGSTGVCAGSTLHSNTNRSGSHINDQQPERTGSRSNDHCDRLWLAITVISHCSSRYSFSSLGPFHTGRGSACSVGISPLIRWTIGLCPLCWHRPLSSMGSWMETDRLSVPLTVIRSDVGGCQRTHVHWHLWLRRENLMVRSCLPKKQPGGPDQSVHVKGA